MKDQEKTKEQLISELIFLRHRIGDPEATGHRHKSVEKAWQKSEEGFRRLSDMSLEGAVIANRGRLVYANPTLSQMLSLKPSEIMGADALQFVLPKYHDLILEVRESGNYAHYQAEMFRKDGSAFPVEISSTAIRDENSRFRAATIRDITDRKHIEELLKTLSKKWPLGIFVVQHGKFCYVNPHLQKSTGFTEAELLKKDSLELVYPEDRSMVRENAVAMLKREQSKPYEFRVYNKAGDVRWVMEAVTPIYYRGSRAALCYYMDVTERKQAEEALGRLTDRELEVLHLIGQGLSNDGISNSLFISRRTVEFHRYSLMRKLNLRNQGELIRYAVQRALLETEDSGPQCDGPSLQ